MRKNNQSISEKPAGKIKIHIQYMEENGKIRTIYLPKISLKFTGKLAGFFVSLAIKNKDSKIDADQAKLLITEVIQVLRELPPFELVNIEDPKDNTSIHIYTCR